MMIWMGNSWPHTPIGVTLPKEKAKKATTATMIHRLTEHNLGNIIYHMG